MLQLVQFEIRFFTYLAFKGGRLKQQKMKSCKTSCKMHVFFKYLPQKIRREISFGALLKNASCNGRILYIFCRILCTDAVLGRYDAISCDSLCWKFFHCEFGRFPKQINWNQSNYPMSDENFFPQSEQLYRVWKKSMNLVWMHFSVGLSTVDNLKKCI